MDTSKNNSLQTLNRTFELLDVLANAAAPMSVIELSKQLGINRTTLYAMLNSLLESKYVDKDLLSGKYVLGYKLFELGQQFRRRFPFLRTARSHAFALMNKWSLNIYISIYIGNGEVLILADEYPVGIRLLHEGAKGPAYATAMGKVLLSGLPVDLLEQELCKISFVAHTTNTITDQTEFRAALQQIRQQGYAFDNQEYVMGLACYSAPIADFSGRTIAALSISGDANKIMANSDKIINDVKITARSISTL